MTSLVTITTCPSVSGFRPLEHANKSMVSMSCLAFSGSWPALFIAGRLTCWRGLVHASGSSQHFLSRARVDGRWVDSPVIDGSWNDANAMSIGRRNHGRLGGSPSTAVAFSPGSGMTKQIQLHYYQTLEPFLPPGPVLSSS